MEVGSSESFSLDTAVWEPSCYLCAQGGSFVFLVLIFEPLTTCNFCLQFGFVCFLNDESLKPPTPCMKMACSHLCVSDTCLSKERTPKSLSAHLVLIREFLSKVDFSPLILKMPLLSPCLSLFCLQRWKFFRAVVYLSNSWPSFLLEDLSDHLPSSHVVLCGSS